MLNPYDANVVEADPGLPALRVLLDDDAALTIFDRSYPHLRPTSARCTYLRYKPGSSCLAAFTLETSQGARDFYAKAYPKTALEKLSKAVDRYGRSPSELTRPVVLPDSWLVLLPFPWDAELQVLEQLHEEAGRSAYISRLAPDRDDLQSARIVPMRYKPERRYVARLDVNGAPQAVLKIHTASHYAQARRALKSLGASTSFETARPLGHSDRHSSILLSWLTGTSLTDSTVPPGSSAVWEAIGGAIADLHNQRIDKLPLRSHQNEIQAVVCQTDDFANVAPALAAPLRFLAERCVAAMAERQSAPVPTHGDFHPGQILVTGRQIATIDLDSAALGNPAYDIGNCIAHLERAWLDTGLDAERHDQVGDALLAGYRNRGQSIHPNVVRIHTAAGLLRLVFEPFRHRQADWHDRTAAILSRAAQLLGACRSENASPRCTSGRPQDTASVRVTDPFAAASDECLPQIVSAIDVSEVRQHVGNIVREAYQDGSLQLQSIRVLRHKPGRRCLIAYDWGSRDNHNSITILGKIHAKKRHERSIRLQRTLWSSGFHDQCADGISVARPVGMVPTWHMWLQEFVAGENGWDAVSGRRGESVAVRIATAARKLHDADILAGRVHTITDELLLLEDKLPKVAEIDPKLTTRIEAVLGACRELADTIPPTPKTGIHRDFYPDQILLSGDRLYLLDLDLYCLGNPELDIGNFCAHLIEKALRSPERADALSRAERRIVDHYLSLTNHSCPQTIDTLTILSLVRHIHLSTQFAERRFFTPSILAQCEQRIALSKQFWSPVSALPNESLVREHQE